MPSWRVVDLSLVVTLYGVDVFSFRFLVLVFSFLVCVFTEQACVCGDEERE